MIFIFLESENYCFEIAKKTFSELLDFTFQSFQSSGMFFILIPFTSLFKYISDLRLQKNHVAGFLILVKNFVAHAGTGSVGRHAINEDMIVQCTGIATIGAMLQKVISTL